MTGINRQPVGLSDLLNVQAGGENPNDLSQTVRPIIDYLPFVIADRLRSEIKSYSLASGQAEFIEVPANEAWLLYWMHVHTDMPAITDERQFDFGIERLQPQGLNNTRLWGTRYFTVVSAVSNQEMSEGWWLPTPLLVTAGQRLTLLANYVRSTPAIGEFTVGFVQLNT